MSTSNLKSMQREMNEMISKQLEHLNTVVMKLNNLENSEEGHCFGNLIDETKSLIDSKKTSLNAIKNKAIGKEDEFYSYLNLIDNVKVDAEEMNRVLDQCDDVFINFRVPDLNNSLFLEPYCDDLRLFIKIHQENATHGREQGNKSLIECLAGNNLHPIKHVLTSVGIKISEKILEFFTSVSVACSTQGLVKKVEEFSILVGLLRIKDKSVVIDSFLAVVELVRTKIHAEKCLCLLSTTILEEQNLFEKTQEMHVTRDILGDILRLEVSFYSPDKPIELTNEVFCLIDHQLSSIFTIRMKVIEPKLNKIKEDHMNISAPDEHQSNLLHLRGPMEEEAKHIWTSVQL